jgi:hypothetical protein
MAEPVPGRSCCESSAFENITENFPMVLEKVGPAIE